MMGQLNNQEAKKALDQISKAQKAVVKQGPREYVPFIGWGLFVLVFYPPFDVLNGNIWGPIETVVWVIGMLLTYRYFRSKAARVHLFSTTPSYIWAGLGTLTALSVFFAETMQTKLSYAWTLSGIVLAVPYIGYGLWLKSRGK